MKCSVKHLASFFIWGCILSQVVGSLCLSAKTTVKTEVYIDLLDAYLLSSVDGLFVDDSIVFQRDLTLAHKTTTRREMDIRLEMAKQVTCPQDRQICRLENEDLNTAGLPKHCGGGSTA